ncbi:hypothetical protein NEOLEDRAFT_1167500 [Neolentinus lepideus HHB14362 ss-1]|uniref:Uncharacterized protein n=1 Tax=Neolentinus lepideus HHB14362 ss-1 TaxID=1314782 RepID=A0A165URU8_9AGAM|nr:hypothetical protein NEOLEDRAFT_1167500 [Neolentinus lepideus HHB14362 ss-1]
MTPVVYPPSNLPSRAEVQNTKFIQCTTIATGAEDAGSLRLEMNCRSSGPEPANLFIEMPTRSGITYVYLKSVVRPSSAACERTLPGDIGKTDESVLVGTLICHHPSRKQTAYQFWWNPAPLLWQNMRECLGHVCASIIDVVFRLLKYIDRASASAICICIEAPVTTGAGCTQGLPITQL